MRTKDLIRLTPKQERFCAEYIIDLNATQAAIRAGYSKKTARQIGAQNLSKLNIQQRIAEKQKKAFAKAEIEAVDVLRELRALGFSNITNYLSFGPDGVTLFDSDNLTEEQGAAIKEVSEYVSRRGTKKIKFKLHGKVHSLELLGKHLKLFTDVMEAHLTLPQALKKLHEQQKHGK